MTRLPKSTPKLQNLSETSKFDGSIFENKIVFENRRFSICRI